MFFRRFLAFLAVLTAVSLLSACDSSEERADKYFKSGLSYLASGDVDRALVEFRNVFKLNGRHKEARLTYARVERERGHLREAFGQYLRLIEQYPDDFEGQLALAEMSSQAGSWDEAQRYVTTALSIDPNNAAAQAVQIVVDYGRAVLRNDAEAVQVAAQKADSMLSRLPKNLMLNGVVIDGYMRSEDYTKAVAAADTALKIAPDDRAIYSMRLAALAALGDDASVEQGLKDIVSRFPDDPAVSEALIRWYVSRKEFGKAEAFLRDRTGPNAVDTTRELELVRFLADNRGPAAAIAELERIIDSGQAIPAFRATHAGLLFDRGNRAEAIAEMEDILKTAQPGEETRKIKVGLARMLVTDGNSVGGRALVEQVLAEDAGDVEALKLKATWLILSDEVGEAITILRRALDQNPREADIMTLMAQAYERDGNRDLMREMLSLAVEASGRAPEESLRYAQFLVSEDKILPAEGVLIDALRMAPSMTELLAPLGQIYVEMKDWPRAEAVAGELEQVGDKEAANQAAALRAAIFGGQQKTDQAIGYLQSLIAEGQGGLAPKIAIIRAHLANGQNQKALAYSAELLASRPDDPSLRFIDASVRSVTGDTVAAEATFRSLVDEDPTRLQVWMALFRVVAADQDRAAEAEALLDKALITLPDQAELQWAKAGMLERRGDFEGAIAIYEGMYTVNSSNQIVANNLASMLSNHRTDQASLDRAEVIARRLRGSGIASYQDTYGWIAYLRGNYEEARGELEKAAAGLPDDPGVQYHLAMTYLKLGEKEKAAEYFGKSVGLLPAESTLPFATPARDELAKLVAEGISTSN